jgi:hypothetical protein
MIFQSSMGLGKSKCDVPSGNTQGCFCLFSTPSLCCSRVCLLGFAFVLFKGVFVRFYICVVQGCVCQVLHINGLQFWSTTHVWL